jgi:hypothetical protein
MNIHFSRSINQAETGKTSERGKGMAQGTRSVVAKEKERGKNC